ncbi:MAG: glycosyltransferase family 2 protein, partial [Elusimicrobiota bacterium]
MSQPISLLSVIIPIYNEEPNIKFLLDELLKCLGRLGINWEILFIDDGSTDNPAATIEKLATEDRIIFIRLARCFGQSAALACGFDHARGDVLVTMDGDAQNDPGDIAALLEKLNDGYDVVCGWRRVRRDGFFRTLASALAN